MKESVKQIAAESLERAINNNSMVNYETIINGFIEMGIDADDITPRENVFTFNAWKALGRVVMKGQKGVKVVTRISCTVTDKETGEETPVLKTKTTAVFHISQTKPIDDNSEEPAPLPADTAEELEARRNAYEERMEAKRERYLDLADKNRTASTAAFQRSHDMASVIPFGQPILIGHHSEKRDRNYRERISNTMRKSCELQNKADYYESKAARVGTGGISSDDPDAVTKLQKKLANLEKSQETMKACNKIIKKYSDEETRVSELMKVGITEAQAREVLRPDCFGGIGFASYALQNNNAEIRRIRGRIDDLNKIKKNIEFTQEEYESFSYQVDNEENRIMFIFPGKPDEEIRTVLKRNAFKYSPTRNAWVRKITNNALYDARTVKEKLLSM